MPTDHAPNPSQSGPQVAVRVFRVSPGTSTQLRTLGEAYGGLLTHWAGGRSRYCCPESCPVQWHKLEAFWKGYFPALVHDKARKLWLPAVFEMTEALELDMRNQFAHAQEWEVSRAPEVKKRKFPVQGRLLGNVDPARIPLAFDIVPVLRTLYHATSIELGALNPCPEKVVMEVMADDGAAASTASVKEPAQLDPDERQKILSSLRRGISRIHEKENSANGAAH